ncbi:MAG: hypothetical protein CMJ22_10290 [Phycisphaerae bacterium]|nr:hypothetical protein [Phycisphaerae bacterium]MCP4066907.1 DedA family protein [Phycisphaeraceae bacterium]MCP4498295.1 DedA family protein [Phycisphaeraceae bacterium]
MHETADQFVQHLFDLYGPIAVFGLLVIAGVGLHLPEDLIIIPAGWEIAAGKFPMFWTVLAAYLGVTGGDTLWFLVCRKFGGRLVGTHWFRKQAHPKRILQVKALYDRHGTWVLLVSRFIPGSRTVGVAVGGLVQLSWGVFLLVELSTAILSVGFQIGLGYAAQRGLSTSGPLHWVTIGVGALLVVTILVMLVVWWRRSKSGKTRIPRARASWLREQRSPCRSDRRTA